MLASWTQSIRSMRRGLERAGYNFSAEGALTANGRPDALRVMTVDDRRRQREAVKVVRKSTVEF